MVVLIRLFRNKRLFVLLLALIFFIALMGLTLGIKHEMTWPEKFVKDTVAWSQGLIYKSAGAAAGFLDDVRSLRNIYEQNKALRSILAQYARDRAKLNTLEAENRRLQELLEFTERQKQFNNYKFHVARVVSQSPDAYNATINIDLGEKDGMKVDMAVVTTEGLIGRIVQVSAFHSTVQLLTSLSEQDPTAKPIAAKAEGKEDSFGMIESYDREKNRLIMTKIRHDDTIAEGDVILSSGLGQVFPKGLRIGTVETREVGSFGITHIAEIKPFASFSHLREVFVVEIPGT